MSRYKKGKTNLDFTEARDSEWQWHQLGHMQVCTSLQTDNHVSTPPLSFLQAGCPSCRPTNSVKALKGVAVDKVMIKENYYYYSIMLVSLCISPQMPEITFSIYCFGTVILTRYCDVAITCIWVLSLLDTSNWFSAAS